LATAAIQWLCCLLRFAAKSKVTRLPQSLRLLRNDDSGVHGLAIPNFTVDRLLGGGTIEPRFEVEILQAREQRRPAGYGNADLAPIRWYAHWCERLLRPPQIFAPASVLAMLRAELGKD